MSTTATTGTAQPASSAAPRSAALDRLRGVAVVLMVFDHLLIVTGQAGSPLRETVTRAAMPLFAVVAGHLSRRGSWRLLGVAVLGLLLPVLVPWVDAPNVLLWLASGSVLVVAARRIARPALWLLPLVVLTAAANGRPFLAPSGSFEPVAVWALMCLGALMSRPGLDRAGARLPAALDRAGRWPLSVYAGHLLVLQLVVVVSGA